MDYKQKLYELIQLLGEKHLDFYFEKTKEEVDSLIEKTLNKYELENDYDFYYVSNYLIKKIIGKYDEHTELHLKDAKWLPCQVKMYDNKLYIIRGCKELEDYRFKEITAINNVDIKQIISEFEDRVCYVKKEWFNVRLGVLLSSIKDIKSLPSIDSSEDIKFTIGGEQINMTEIYNNTSDNVANSLEPISYEVLNDTIVIKYSLCREKYENQMIDTVEKIKRISKQKKITNYIVDLRGNSGGNSEIIKPLIEYLTDKNIVTLVNNSVYSSGLWACNDLKNIGSTFIGANIGTVYNKFGNIKKEEFGDFELRYSFKYFYYNEETKQIDYIDNYNDFKKFKLNPDNKKYFVSKDFVIDEEIEITLEGFINQNDPILDRTLQLLHQNKIKK